MSVGLAPVLVPSAVAFANSVVQAAPVPSELMQAATMFASVLVA